MSDLHQYLIPLPPSQSLISAWIVITIIDCIGLLANTLALRGFFKARLSLHYTDAYLLNIVLSDTVFLITAILEFSYSVATHERLWHPWLCVVGGYVKVFTTIMTIHCLFALAICRYRFVVCGKEVTRQFIVVSFLVIFSSSLVWCLAPMTIGLEYGLTTNQFTCLPHWVDAVHDAKIMSYNVFLMIICSMLVVGIIICYQRILLFINKILIKSQP